MVIISRTMRRAVYAEGMEVMINTYKRPEGEKPQTYGYIKG
jgi:hypothetical protein